MKRLGRDFALLSRVFVCTRRFLPYGRSSLKIHHLVLHMAEFTKDKLKMISRWCSNGVGIGKRGYAMWVNKEGVNHDRQSLTQKGWMPPDGPLKYKDSHRVK